MRAVVLVGGFGTRLRPLTATRPKQMLAVLDRPMIERVAAWLAAGGVEDVVLSLGYRPEAFTDAYPSGRCAGVTLHYAVEPSPLGTAGAIAFAADHWGIGAGHGSFLVVNGDVLTDLDLATLLSLHERCGAEGTLALTPVAEPSRYGVVPIDADNRVEAFVEKPPVGQAPSRWINAGVYVLEPSLLDRIPRGRPVSVERETFPALVAHGGLYALQSEAYWIDAGTPASYLQANLDAAAAASATATASAGPAGSWIHPTAVIDSSARLHHAVIGARAQISTGTTVQRAVIGEGASIGAGTTVADSLVGPLATIGRHCRIDGLSVIGDGSPVRDGSVLSGARLPDSH